MWVYQSKRWWEQAWVRAGIFLWKPVISVAHSSGKPAKSYKNYFLTSLFVMRKVSSAMCCTILRWILHRTMGHGLAPYLDPHTAVASTDSPWEAGMAIRQFCAKEKIYLFCYIFPHPSKVSGFFPTALCKPKETTAGLQIWVSSLHEHGLRGDSFNKEKKNGKYFFMLEKSL